MGAAADIRLKFEASRYVRRMGQSYYDLQHHLSTEGKAPKNFRQVKWRYEGQTEVWSLAISHLIGAPDSVTVGDAAREALDTRFDAEAFEAAFWSVWSHPLKAGRDDFLSMAVRAACMEILHAWGCEEPVNIYKVRQRSAQEEWRTSLVDTWCEVVGIRTGIYWQTFRTSLLKAIQTTGPIGIAAFVPEVERKSLAYLGVAG